MMVIDGSCNKKGKKREAGKKEGRGRRKIINVKKIS